MTRGDGPVIALPWVILGTLPLLECLVQTEVMPDAILPSVLVDAVELERVGDPFVDRSKGEAAVWCTQDSHADQLGITIRRLGAVVV